MIELAECRYSVGSFIKDRLMDCWSLLKEYMVCVLAFAVFDVCWFYAA